MLTRRILHLATAFTILACSPTTPSASRTMGVVLPGLPGVPVIQAPDTVQAGFPVAILINTFGSSGCTTPAGLDLQLSPSTVTITPFDQFAPEDQACTRDYAARPHPVDVTFTTLGPAQIVVRGISTGGTAPGRSVVTITKDVYVLR